MTPTLKGCHRITTSLTLEQTVMPQSLSSILVHLVFSTKHREPLIALDVEAALYAYLSGILKAKCCPALTIGGMPDHVHVLFQLARTAAISDVVEDLKKDSSRWIKTRGAAFGGFYWQAGFGAFSVGQSNVETTRKYIDNQKTHHTTRTFQEEYRILLRKYAVEFDERYVWD